MADVTLKYKGATIGELSDSGSKTIETAGKYCEDDILLEYVKSGGGTLRTTHYNGKITFQNTQPYSITLPVPLLSTDIFYVYFRLSKTGTIVDGDVVWDDSIMIPPDFNASGKRLNITGGYMKGLTPIDVFYSDSASMGSWSQNGGSVRQSYNKNSGNTVNLNLSNFSEGVSITLTGQGYNGAFCRAGYATEYEYDVFVMTSEGNAIVV